MASLNIIYREKDVPNIHQYDVYVKNGGYEGLKKALSMDPKAVIDEVKASNLRGRGGAGFPTGVKWSFIPQSEPIKYVTVNADESETGTFKDRQILENNPHQLIEGAMICAWAIQATAVYIYLRGEFWDVAHELDKRIAEAYAAWLGRREHRRHRLDRADCTPTSARAPTSAARKARCSKASKASSVSRKCARRSRRNKGGGLYGEPTVDQQRRDADQRPLDHGQRRGGVQEDRHRAKPRHESLLPQRSRQ